MNSLQKTIWAPHNCTGLDFNGGQPKRLNFPQHIAKTTVRPDIILVSKATTTAVISELTVPWEEAFERNKEKYEGLVRDFAGQSLDRSYAALGLTGERRRRRDNTNTEAAESAPRWLWLKRADPWEPLFYELFDHNKEGSLGVIDSVRANFKRT